MFDNFINSFCKVQFLCYEGEPNWLGIIVQLFFFLVLLLIFIVIIEIIGEWVSDFFDK